MTLEEDIKKTRNIKDSSIRTYLIALKTLKLRYNNTSDIDNIEWLNDYDKIFKLLEDEKLTVRKNKLSAILVALKSKPSFNIELYNRYNDLLKKYNDEYNGFLTTQTKTETQKKNWIEYKELIELYDTLLKEVRKRHLLSKKEWTKEEFRLFQELLILKTYMDFPLRNDFADMCITTIKKYRITDDNCMVKENHNDKYFYINSYKNKKYMGNKVYKIGVILNRLINIWLKHNKSGYYLVQTDRITPMNPNDITKFLNTLFKRTLDKSISTSMIRHISISHDMEGQHTIKEKDDLDNKYLHNAYMNDRYRKL